MKEAKEADTLLQTHLQTPKKSSQTCSGRFSACMFNNKDISLDGANKYTKKLAKKIKKLTGKIES